MRRRDLLLSALALKASPATAQTKGEWRNQQSGMAYRQLGRTGYMVSEIVMGGNTISPKNYDHVLAAIDMGLNYLDTAPAYGGGQSELGYAEVLKIRKRDQFFLNSKVSLWDINRNRLYQDIYKSLDDTEQKRLRHLALDEIARRKADAPDYFINYFNGQRDELDQASLANVMAAQYGSKIDRAKNYRQLILDSVDQSLQTLGTDHLDLLMCPHGANTPYEIQNHPEIFEAFETLKKAGKARHLGLSSHTDPGGVLEAAAKTKMYSVAMVAYNMVNSPYVSGAIAAAKQSGMGIISMKSARPFNFRAPRETPAAQMNQLHAAVPGDLKPMMKAYLWNLRNPNLTAAISEMATMEHVKDNVPLAGAKEKAA
ncbi:aldo/keto reductase [Bryobacter aggregatus]|uniref:aldo/keto reductase n=1 Tax=Bryobacter aggregatus TaxID=360054 RepID=UPI0004E1D106|nr:aldo/keto reductase [Bryobacter aggregatus]